MLENSGATKRKGGRNESRGHRKKVPETEKASVDISRGGRGTALRSQQTELGGDTSRGRARMLAEKAIMQAKKAPKLKKTERSGSGQARSNAGQQARKSNSRLRSGTPRTVPKGPALREATRRVSSRSRISDQDTIVSIHTMGE